MPIRFTFLNPYFTGLIPVSDVSWQYELSAASILLWIGPNMAPISNVRVKWYQNLHEFGKSRWKNLWAICAEDVGNYLRPSKQSRPAIGRLPNCSTNSRPGLNRIFLMVAAWLRLLGRILFQIWIQIFIQTNIFLFYFFSITSISNMFTYF